MDSDRGGRGSEAEGGGASDGGGGGGSENEDMSDWRIANNFECLLERVY